MNGKVKYQAVATAGRYREEPAWGQDKVRGQFMPVVHSCRFVRNRGQNLQAVFPQEAAEAAEPGRHWKLLRSLRCLLWNPSASSAPS